MAEGVGYEMWISASAAADEGSEYIPTNNGTSVIGENDKDDAGANTWDEEERTLSESNLVRYIIPIPSPMPDES